MMAPRLSLLFALMLASASASAQRRIVPSDSSLYAAREAVWRAYFANSPDLADALTADFVGIATADSVWRDRSATLAEAKASAEHGTRLVELRFPRNVLHRYGNVAVIHSRYDAVLAEPTGNQPMRGRITEVFVWNGKRWMHSSWQMDFDH